MWRCKWVFAATLIVALGATPAWSLTNLLPNGGMEDDANGDGVADGWVPNIHATEGAEGSLSIDREIKRSGVASQRIEHTSDNAAWVRSSVARVDSRADGVYRVDAWLRGDAEYQVLVYEFFANSTEYATTRVADGTATDEWQQVSAIVTASENTSFFKISLVTTSRGTAWFDDASMVLIAERPTLRVPRVDAGPTVDGDLSDAAWQGVPVADGFMVLDGGGELPSVGTSTRMCFDAEAMYIAFDCEEPNVPGMALNATEDGHAVWGDDCVEVFVDIEGDRVSYLHLGVNARGFKWQDRRLGGMWYTDWFSPGGQDVPAPEWSAAAKIEDGRWRAEMRVPFDQIGGTPRPATVWGANFCRTRRATGAEENLCWSYTSGEFYAIPERFGTLVFATGATQPPERVARDMTASPEPAVVPQPQQVEWQPGVFRIAEGTRVVVAGDVSMVGAEMLAADMQKRFGLKLEVTRGETALKGILVRVDETDRTLRQEGYRLTVGEWGVEIAGKDARGAFYGIQTLRQLVNEDQEGPLLDGCTIVDWPDIAWRGWHLSGPKQTDLATYRKFIDTLALMKFNQVCMEVNGNLQYESHPTIAGPEAPTRAELKELVAYARERHMTVFPQLATFAHFGYALRHAEYAELAEAPEGSTKGHQDQFNYCPLHPRTLPMVLDLMDELIEVFEPEYFHIGRDEATFDDIATCPRCTGIAPSKLFTDDIIALHDHLAEKGITTLMWGDMYLPSHNGIKQYNVAEATDDLPKDIVICDWHYSADYDFDASLNYWEEHGFRVLGNPWYEPMNVWNFATKTKEHEILGYMGTTWSGIGSHIGRYPHLPAGWVLAAENAWSVEKPTLAEITYQPVPTFNRLWEMGRPVAKSFRALDLAAFCNEGTVDGGRGAWMGAGPQYDLRSLPTGLIWVGETPFRLVDGAANDGKSCVMLADETTRPGLYPESVWEIPVGMATEAIRFLHTCSLPRVRLRPFYDRKGERMTTLGRYTITYEDGSEAVAELVYLANMSEWNSQRGPSAALDLWQGKTAAGAVATLGVWEWRNPEPDKPVASIGMTSALGQARPVLLGVTVVE